MNVQHFLYNFISKIMLTLTIKCYDFLWYQSKKKKSFKEKSVAWLTLTFWFFVLIGGFFNTAWSAPIRFPLKSGVKKNTSRIKMGGGGGVVETGNKAMGTPKWTYKDMNSTSLY